MPSGSAAAAATPALDSAHDGGLPGCHRPPPPPLQVDFADWKEPLLLESFERTRLCDELAICWKADFMFRNWRWQPFTLKKGNCSVGRKDRTANEFTVAPEKMQVRHNARG